LWQLPPSLRFDAAVLKDFLARLPVDTAAALAIANRHEAFMAERCCLEIDTNRPLRHCMEVRNASFDDPRFFELLRRYNVALVAADTAGRYPCIAEVTADFAYIRLHGENKLYYGPYSEAALDRWAERIRTWATHGD